MIYVSSACIRKKSIAEIVRLYAENHIQNIELSGGTDYYNEIEADLQNLKTYFRLNYACHAYFPPPQDPFVVNLASCNDQIYKRSIDHYVHCIEMLKCMECKVLSIHAGFLIEIGVDEIGKQLHNRIVYDEFKAYERFCDAYEYIAKLCEDNGISFFLENNVLNVQNYKEFGYHNYMMMTDYESIIKMKKQLDFNLLLDLGHLHVSANTLGLDYGKECDMLQPYIKWIHISENNGVMDEHKPLREDSPIIKELSKLYHPDINITLETEGSVQDIIESIKMVESIQGDFLGGS